jgi:hypothetical protein
MKEMKVTFVIDKHQETALEELQEEFEKYLNSEEAAIHPATWNLQKTLQAIMYTGSMELIWKQIKAQQHQFGLISFEEYIDGKYLTIAERKAEGQQNVQDNHMEAETTEGN